MELKEEFVSEVVKEIGWIDIHAHLNFLEISPEEALKEAKEKGVQKVITIGTEPKDLPVVQELAETWAPDVYCTLGIHPHEGKLYNQEIENYLRANLVKDRVVAVGEIGLDFYYDNSPKEEQIEAFRAQMRLAEEFDLPVEIHTRDAEAETIEILKEFDGKVKGLIHCFTGTQNLANHALDYGYNISFSGIVTFKNAQDLRDVVVQVPLDRMHVETDAPFLAPVPMRGRKNQPDFMLYTAQKVAEIKGIEIETFCRQMKQNAQKMFAKLDWN